MELDFFIFLNSINLVLTIRRGKMSSSTNWDEILEQIKYDREKKRHAAINFYLIRQEQSLSLVSLSELLNIDEEALAVFERRGECSEYDFNQIIDWMLEVLDKRPDH